MKTTAVLSANEGGACALAAAGEIKPHSIESRAILTTPELRVTWFAFAAEQELSEHTNPARALIQVLSGRGEFTVSGKPHTLGPGELLHMPPRAPHAVRALEPMTMLLTLSPVRAV